MPAIIRAIGFTGRRQTLNWPSNVSYSADVEAYIWGAGGGQGGNDGSSTGGAGSGGGFASHSFVISPGDVIEVSVGSQGGPGRSNQPGAPPGEPGASLVLAPQPFNSLDHGLARSTNGAYTTFLNNYGVWNNDPSSRTFDRSFSAVFPVSGFYTILAAVDNFGTVSIDGTVVLHAPGFHRNYTVKQFVTAGTRTVRLRATNTGGPGSFACTIIAAGDNYSGGFGGQAGFAGSSGAGGGGGGATVLRVNGLVLAVAGGGGGGAGAGSGPGGGQPGNATQPATASVVVSGGQGQSQPSDGGGGGGGGSGSSGGLGGAAGPTDTWGFAGQFGLSATVGGTTNDPNGRLSGGRFSPFYPGSVGDGGAIVGGGAVPALPGYAVLEFNINGTYVRDAGIWKKTNRVYVRRDNSWQGVQASYVRQNNQWQPVEGSDAPNFQSQSNLFGYARRGPNDTFNTSWVFCVAVIDECSVSAGTISSDWQQFLALHPLRLFRLLQPGGPGRGPLKVPSNYARPQTRGPITVNRDGGNAAAASDWFALCQMQNADQNCSVLLSIDNSGSMTSGTVAASTALFLERCAVHGIPVQQRSMGGGGFFFSGGRGENWVQPFLT